VAFPFLSSSRPLVFAHRGGAALAPENTFAAFDNGLALGADGLELDVHLSGDGQVMVHHELPRGRQTNFGAPTRDISSAEATASRFEGSVMAYLRWPRSSLATPMCPSSSS
jgi:glycerophosphoryl diester phosphodiesterase